MCIQLCIIGVDYTLKICQSFIYTCQEYKYTQMPAESDGQIAITMSVMMLKPMGLPVYSVCSATSITRIELKMLNFGVKMKTVSLKFFCSFTSFLNITINYFVVDVKLRLCRSLFL